MNIDSLFIIQVFNKNKQLVKYTKQFTRVYFYSNEFEVSLNSCGSYFPVEMVK